MVGRIPFRFLFCRLAGLLLTVPCPFLIESNVRVPLIRTFRWRTVLQSSKLLLAGADPGEVKWVNFHPPPPLFLSPLLSFFFFFFLISQILK